MADPAQEQSEIELAAGDKRLKIRSSDMIGAGTFVVVCLLGYAFYLHSMDTKETNQLLISVLKDMAQAQREQNCLIALPQDRRERESEFCKRVTR